MALEERDPVTGRLTTGHEWNGIKELNTNIPKVVIFFLALSILISIGYWILMPAWPLGTSYTKGILGIDQRTQVQEQLAAARRERSDWTREIEQKDFDAILSDPGLMLIARESGHTLFGDNCAVCHGTQGAGGEGYPALSAGAWLWGGEPETIAETLRVGINANHPETRIAEMLAFGRDGMLSRDEVRDVVSFVRSLGSTPDSEDTATEAIARGKEVFADNCASCHGDSAEGNLELGAPDLTDDVWIYGGDRGTIYRTVFSGRQGHMPSWEGRLSLVERKILTLYVLSLQGEK